jgi:DNA processing protein
VVDTLSESAEARGEARALLVLDHLPGVGLAALKSLVRTFGSGAEALRAPRSAFRRSAGDAAEVARWDPSWGRIVDAGLAEADRLGMEIRTWTSPEYPAALHHLHDPPPVLFLRGRAELLGEPGITVVGARRATSRARDVAERLGRALAQAGTCVVSGLALGIDAAAHRGALLGGGPTVAVLGRGGDAPYPPTHRRLFAEILGEGLVVSEFLPGTPPLPHHFPRRNRILAGLAQAVVVVEAGAKSGSLITVDHALDLGLDVWSVPGPIDVPSCAGSNRLLVDGARPLVSVDDFVREVTGLGGAGEAETLALVDGPAGALLARLGGETLNVDELAQRAGVPVPAALALLTELELTGLVRQLPGMRFRRAA